MWIVTNGAALAHRFMLENKRAGLFAMTRRATFIQSRHRQAAGGFENVAAVRIMALRTIDPVLDNGMMMRQIEFSARFKMTLKTSGGVLARIVDEHAAAAAGLNVSAARTVARFTAGSARELCGLQMHARMGAAGKLPGNVRVTLGAGFIAGIGCARNLRRRQHRALNSRTGTEQNTKNSNASR